MPLSARQRPQHWCGHTGCTRWVHQADSAESTRRHRCELRCRWDLSERASASLSCFTIAREAFYFDGLSSFYEVVRPKPERFRLGFADHGRPRSRSDDANEENMMRVSHITNGRADPRARD
eukprot:783654-Rhodomonas_salina.2